MNLPRADSSACRRRLHDQRNIRARAGEAARADQATHRRPDRDRLSDAGFMLIDAIIATAILAGAVIAAARVVTVASSLNIAARQTTLSAALAAGSLEGLRARGTLLPNESGSEDVLPSGTAAAADERHLAYTVRWAAEALPNPSLVRVTVVVHAAGPGRGRVGRSASLSTVRRSDVR